MRHAICFHLHCYQPPREDPWLGVVEPEWSAFPYHDWNQRIAAECYRPNAFAAVLRDGELLTAVGDNFAATSFDFGPTLHEWLEVEAPDVEAAVRAAGGAQAGRPTGAALCAPRIHAILPLATPSDREVLVAWGITDFVARFGFKPDGIWLPEAAVDLDTLQLLARMGLRFTVLMPEQAARVRAPGGEWHAVDRDSLDTSRGYRVPLPGGESIDVVFGNGPLSRGIAFDGMLDDGAQLASVVRATAKSVGGEGLVAIVSDGETFGHHHRFGEMALAWAVRALRAAPDTTVTNVDTWLREHPPTWEVEIVSPSAWSCAHGVERWRSDCGCTTGSQPGWNQQWRAPLRAALDWLRATLHEAATKALEPLVTDPHALLVDYGRVLANAEAPADFVARHTVRPPTPPERTRVLEMLEMERHLLSAFTSCAWFFAESTEIETRIVLRHAAVAIDIARRVLAVDPTEALLTKLAKVRSNLDPTMDGAILWHRVIEPERVDAAEVAAQWALEAAAGPGEPPATRGVWRITAGARAHADDPRRVIVEHTRTLRSERFEVGSRPRGAFGAVGWARPLEAGRPECAIDLEHADVDVAQRYAATKLTGARTGSPMAALRAFVPELRGRVADVDDVMIARGLLAATAPALGPDAAIVRTMLALLRDAAAPSSPATAALTILAPIARIARVEWPDGHPLVT